MNWGKTALRKTLIPSLLKNFSDPVLVDGSESCDSTAGVIAVDSSELTLHCEKLSNYPVILSVLSD